MVAAAYQYQQAQQVSTDASKSATSTILAEPAHVDEATALRIASDLAIAADLAVAKNIANLSTSVDLKAQMAQTNEDSIKKPLLVRATPYNRDVTTYTTKEGDTTQSVASAHNITEQTLKWANNLTESTLEADKSLSILPLDGILYTVKADDTLESVSEKYKANADRIVSYNDLELSKIESGQKLIIPDGTLPEEERPGYVAPAPVATSTPAPSTPTITSAPAVTSPSVDTSAGNMYAFGNCTSYAYERRMQMGRPIGSFWGNAATWNTFAMQQGFAVNKTPAPGAVFHMPAFVDAYTGVYGHVGIVESVNSDGSIYVSEMNYAGAFNAVTYRTIPASQAALYNYIH